MDAGPILLTIIVLLFVIGLLSIVLSIVYDKDYIVEKQILSSSHRNYRPSETIIIDDDNDQEYDVLIEDDL